MQPKPFPFELGDCQGYVLCDNAQVDTAEGLIVDPNIEELERITQAYDFEIDRIPLGYNNLLLRAGERYVLVDAGIRRPDGMLSSGLQELDVDPGDIDTIVITHSDRDHVGGILDEKGEIAFPNARYIMLENAWQYWSSEDRRNELTELNRGTEEITQFVWEIYSRIKDSINLVKAGEEFAPGFGLYPAPGHRYDHSILKVVSSNDRLVHLSDAVIHPLFMGDRDWYSTYDSNPAVAIETKAKLLDLCAAENALVFGAHFPFPGLGTVQQEKDNWTWQPIDVA